MNNQAFSIMKGIAIISVVLGHCTTNSRIEAFGESISFGSILFCGWLLF